MSYVNYLVYEARSSANPQRILAAAEYTSKARKLPSLVFIVSSVKKETVISPFFSGRIVLPESLVDNVEKASRLFQNLVPTYYSVERTSPKQIIRDWFVCSLKTFLKLYRLWKIS